MRFLVDECVPTYITVFLREQGYDVLDPRDAGQRGATDEALLKVAASESRVIVTRDLGFNILITRGFKPAGIILLRYPNSLSPRLVAQLFELFVMAGGLERTPGMIVVITPGRARFRPLDWCGALGN
ncbi:MAG: DUF5615 family PIN-like protein [Anaerolineae bacterium]